MTNDDIEKLVQDLVKDLTGEGPLPPDILGNLKEKLETLKEKIAGGIPIEVIITSIKASNALANAVFETCHKSFPLENELKDFSPKDVKKIYGVQNNVCALACALVGTFFAQMAHNSLEEYLEVVKGAWGKKKKDIEHGAKKLQKQNLANPVNLGVSLVDKNVFDWSIQEKYQKPDKEKR